VTSHFEFQRSVIMANPSKAGEQPLQKGEGKPYLCTGMGNALPSSGRKEGVRLKADEPALESDCTQVQMIIMFSSGSCLVCFAHFGSIRAISSHKLPPTYAFDDRVGLKGQSRKRRNALHEAQGQLVIASNSDHLSPFQF